MELNFKQVNFWLQKPFPYVQSYVHTIGISSLAGIFVTIFLFVFKPFGIENAPYLFYYLTGYGAISFIAIFFSLQILPLLFPAWFDRSRWNVYKNILLMFWILLTISCLNWLYVVSLIDYGIFFSHPHNLMEPPVMLIENIGMTFSVGIFPVLTINYILEKQLFKKNVQLAKQVENQIDKSAKLAKYITLEIPDDKGKHMKVSSQNLIAVKAEGGNYVTVYWLENDQVKKQLWRITLKNLLDILSTDQNIFKCHKSYLVNRLHITRVEGNARTLMLHLSQLGFAVPVSRNFPRGLLIRNP